MNERIRELAKQAGFYPENNWDHTNWHAAGHNPTFEKFAELIVKETMQVVANQLPSNVYLDVANAVIKHYKEN
jgi:hypothetical protein